MRPSSFLRVQVGTHVASLSALASSTRAPFREAPAYPKRLKLFEMGPRDGLQSEARFVPTEAKVEFIQRLLSAGSAWVEATSFVSPKAVPQLGDGSAVLAGVAARSGELRRRGATLSALVPNIKGFEAAAAAGLTEVAVFAAASDAFSQKNINCNVQTSLERFAPVFAAAAAARIRVRAYVSCALGCPYSGHVAPAAAAFVARALLDAGAYEVSLGDTIGVGSPPTVRSLLLACRDAGVPIEATAVHFHATYGLALANIATALEMGISVVDASVGGLGGCPYARGASGNVATEDVLYLTQALGIEVEGNPDIDALAETGDWMCKQLGVSNRSYVGVARLSHSRVLNTSTAVEEEAIRSACRVGLSWPVKAG
jgi:hydroxymethylglutaryl-CoA lyase